MELKFGKLPPRIDKRTIPLSKILKVKLLPELPTSYNLHEVLNVDDDFMFANDKYGNCVKASRAHQTLVFEAFEQGKQIKITDQEVVDDYFKETGGPDSGLYLLDSLKDWRKDGWEVGGKVYTIYAFASVDWKNHDEVKHCIHLLGGVNFGMMVFQKDIDQFNAGEDWELTGFDSIFRSRHGVYLYAYGHNHHDCPHCAVGWDEDGIICMTWGRRQKMSWNFWDARVDEAYAIVDNEDKWLMNSPVDVVKLNKYLKEITGESEPENGCPVIRGIVKAGKFIAKGFGW